MGVLLSCWTPFCGQEWSSLNYLPNGINSAERKLAELLSSCTLGHIESKIRFDTIWTLQLVLLVYLVFPKTSRILEPIKSNVYKYITASGRHLSTFCPPVSHHDAYQFTLIELIGGLCVQGVGKITYKCAQISPEGAPRRVIRFCCVPILKKTNSTTEHNHHHPTDPLDRFEHSNARRRCTSPSLQGVVVTGMMQFDWISKHFSIVSA